MCNQVVIWFVVRKVIVCIRHRFVVSVVVCGNSLIYVLHSTISSFFFLCFIIIWRFSGAFSAFRFLILKVTRRDRQNSRRPPLQSFLCENCEFLWRRKKSHRPQWKGGGMLNRVHRIHSSIILLRIKCVFAISCWIAWVWRNGSRFDRYCYCVLCKSYCKSYSKYALWFLQKKWKKWRSMNDYDRVVWFQVKIVIELVWSDPGSIKDGSQD